MEIFQIVNMYREVQETGTTVSVYRHLLNTVEGVSWFGATFYPVVFGIFSYLIEKNK